MAKPTSNSTITNRKRHMSTKLRRDIMRRIADGEKANEIAWELGFSSAAVYRLMRNYRQRGEAAFYRANGKEIVDDDAAYPSSTRRPHQMEDVHFNFLRKVLPSRSPDEMGIAKGFTVAGKWSAPEVKALLRREFGAEPSHDECARVQHLLGLRSHLRNPSQFKAWRDDLSDVFLDWQKSPKAKALAKRELSKIGTHSPDQAGAAPRGRIFEQDRAWRNSLRKYILEDPALGAATAKALAKALLEIEQNETANA